MHPPVVPAPRSSLHCCYLYYVGEVPATVGREAAVYSYVLFVMLICFFGKQRHRFGLLRFRKVKFPTGLFENCTFMFLVLLPGWDKELMAALAQLLLQQLYNGAVLYGTTLTDGLDAIKNGSPLFAAHWPATTGGCKVLPALFAATTAFTL
jgi:hypothetical protein